KRQAAFFQKMSSRARIRMNYHSVYGQRLFTPCVSRVCPIVTIMNTRGNRLLLMIFFLAEISSGSEQENT
ncbi:MAG: hypothetical protein PHG65_10565, partial [Kiritimatiellae bacterium]|nr:hypothetical protein [Kiritimatiellia bacterium]